MDVLHSVSNQTGGDSDGSDGGLCGAVAVVSVTAGVARGAFPQVTPSISGATKSKSGAAKDSGFVVVAVVTPQRTAIIVIPGGFNPTTVADHHPTTLASDGRGRSGSGSENSEFHLFEGVWA